MKDRRLLVFTSFPRKGRAHDEKTVGGAAYTKKLLEGLREEDRSLEIEVLAEVLPGEESCEEGGIEVRRVWRRNGILSIAKAVLLALRRGAGTVLVSYEASMVGGKIANGIFLLGILFLRLCGKRTIFLLHQVLETFRPLAPGRLEAILLDLAKGVLFRLIALASSERIVFEEHLAGLLRGRRRPAVVPFAVEDLQPLDPAAARKRLGLEEGAFHVLFFGYLSPYKGLDLLLEIFDFSKARLIVAGGGNPNHLGNRRYSRSVDSVRARAREKGAVVAGFVPEEEIPLYFSAADLAIFPYRIFFSSSYALSLAFSHEKPVLLSRPLEKYFESGDFQEAAAAAGLSREDLVFDFAAGDLSRKISLVLGSREKYVRFSGAMKKARSWKSAVAKLGPLIRHGEAADVHPPQ